MMSKRFTITLFLLGRKVITVPKLLIVLLFQTLWEVLITLFKKTDKANIELSDECDNNKDKCDFDRSKLDKIRTKNFDRLIIGNLNINSLSLKFDQLKLLIQGKGDILIITETKLDDIFLLINL